MKVVNAVETVKMNKRELDSLANFNTLVDALQDAVEACTKCIIINKIAGKTICEVPEHERSQAWKKLTQAIEDEVYRG